MFKKPFRFVNVLIVSVVLLSVCTMSGWMFYTNQKHTGPVTLIAGGEGWSQFLRPNGELFVMRFVGKEIPAVQIGAKFSNVVYSDESKDTKHFILGSGYQPPTPSTSCQVTY